MDAVAWYRRCIKLPDIAVVHVYLHARCYVNLLSTKQFYANALVE